MALVTSTSSKLYSGFDPRTIPGCIVWLDGADPNGDGTPPSNGATVASWKDKSGKGNHATSQVGTPTYSAASKCIYFNGSTYYKLPDGSIPTGNTAYSFYFVAAPTLADYQWVFSSGYNDTRAIGLVFYPNGTLEHGWWTTNVRTSSGVFTANQPALISGQYNVPGLYTYKNGTTVSSNVSSTNRNGAAENIHIGNRMDGTPSSLVQQYAGNIYEIILFEISTPEHYRRQIEGYLARKWGLVSSIPATHPYRSLPLVTRPFNPLDISGCALWLDAMDSMTLTISGSNVTSWKDKSGNGYNFNTAPNGCSLPVLGNPINGRQTIGITTSTMGIKQATVINGINTIVWVRRERTGNRAYEFYFGADSTADFHTGISEYAGSGLAQNGVRDASLALITANGTTYGKPGTTNVTSASDVNILEITNLTGNTRVQGLSYDRGNVGRSMQCDWGEILFYTNNLTTSQMNMLEGYLAQRWGIRSSHLGSSHPFKLLPSIAPAFSPLQISGCRLWLDAADPATITLTGSNVTQWNDKSGNGYNISPLSGFSNATVQSNYQNGMNVLNFQGSNIYRGPAGSGVYPSDVYVLVALKSLSSRSDVVSIAATSADNFNSLTLGEAATSRWHNGSDNFNRTPNSVSSVDETSTGFLLMNWSLSNNNFVIRRNGTQIGFTNSYTFTLTSGSVFQIGLRYAHANSADIPFNAYMAEVLVFNTQLSTDVRQRVEGYLTAKWGLRGNLASTHGFKTITP